jgi:WD40-like Beta Propeller Repeat
MLAWRKAILLCGLVGVSTVMLDSGSASAAAATNSPKLFAPGNVSGPADDLSPAFSPDGKAVYFTRGNNSASTILLSTQIQGHWSAPTIASFSGQWNDIEPAMAPDGSHLVFSSNRPIDAQGSVLDATYNGKVAAGGGGNLWRVDRRGERWASPKRLPEAINSGTAVFSPSIAGDGSLYFMRQDGRTGTFHLFRSAYRSGNYQEPEPVNVGDPTTEEVDPAIAPDESFMVFTSNHPARHDQKRLMIAFHDKLGWAAPQDLGDEVNEAGNNIEARLGSDHRTLYFSTNTVPPVSFPRSLDRARSDLTDMLVWANGRQNIWYVSLASWIDRDRTP